MKLRNQVVSLKLARKMKELGFRQRSLWYWAVEMLKGAETRKWSLCQHNHLLPEHPKYSAYTVAELGQYFDGWFIPCFMDGLWTWSVTGVGISGKEKTEANARAKMLIYLKGKEGKTK